MSPRAFAVVVLVGLGVAGVAGRQSTPARATTATPEAQWLRAVDAWEAGQYPAALEDLRAVLKTASAADYLERVALLTGELYVTTELTPNGANPEVSANGQYVSYETGMPAMTRVVRVAPKLDTVADLATTNVAFDRSGRRLAWLRSPAGGAASATEIVVRDLTSGAERVWLGAGLLKASIAWSGDDQSVLFVGGDEADQTRSDVYSVRDGSAPVKLTESIQSGHKINVQVGTNGTLVYTVSANSPFGGGRAGGGRGAGGGGGGGGRAGGGGAAGAGAAATPPPTVVTIPATPPATPPAAGGGQPQGGGRGGGGAPQTFFVVNAGNTTGRAISGTALTLSADGSTIAWLQRNPDGTTVLNSSPATSDAPKALRTVTAPQRINAPTLSPDGQRVAYELMTSTDWEIYITDQAGAHTRVTRDIQHDIVPKFLTNQTMVGLMGEPRHRRSQLYDLNAGTRTRLFSNNTLRTISPEYIWVPSADGLHVVIQADRDGDTISTERGVSIVDLTRRVSVADVLARIDRQLAVENQLRQAMTKAYAPLKAQIERVLAKASVSRVYQYEKSLFDFDSKHITQPGNAKAIAYLEKTYRSFGYEPEVQWFSPNNALGGKTANVFVRLTGTENPELVYVVSSHFDSVPIGPGADDDTSGTAALLEAARVLADNPLPVTVVLASFTGEEAGLLGSREFVRQATANKWNVVGALNNDMIGWAAEGPRMDNTIRYSNAGIKDLQHGASTLFTKLITYDARYYRGTDANAFFDAWGDIVGGIGSYPVLANPNYHQPTDLLETMNFQQITETSKTTVATIIYLASSPSRLKDLRAVKTATATELTWTPSPEAGIKTYIVAYGPATDPLRTRVTVSAAKATLPALPAGTQIAVKAVNGRGLEGWDWARTAVQ